MTQRRLYTRYDFSAAATITDSSGRETLAQVTNISVGGCRLITGNEFPVGARVVIRIQSAADRFEAPANVVHCADDGVGLMFNTEHPQSLLVLNKWIKKAIETQAPESTATYSE